MVESTLVDPAAERCVLGAILTDNTIFADIESRIRPDDFGVKSHGLIFGAIGKLIRSGAPADQTTLTRAMRDSGALAAVGGAAIFAELQAEVPSTQNAGSYAEIVAERSVRRSLGKALVGAVERLKNHQEPTMAVYDEVMRILSGLTSRSTRRLTGLDLLDQVYADMEKAAMGQGERIISTGFPSLDDAILGWQPTLNIIGAQPGVGKSALLASTTRSMAKAGYRVAIFSLEDHPKWLAWRMLSAEAKVRQGTLRTGRLNAFEKEKVEACQDELKGYMANVIVDGSHAMSPSDLVHAARSMIVNDGVDAVIVDHLGELRFERAYRDRYDLDLMDGLSDLRSIAKSHNVPVIVAAHFKRTEHAEPKLTDFANSSAPERQARVALGLTRDPGSDILKVHVLKNTNGGPAGPVIDLHFVGISAMVRDCEGVTQ